MVQYYERARDYLHRIVKGATANDPQSKNSQLMSGITSDQAARLSDAYFRAAMLETDMKNFKAAEKNYKEALKRDPTSKIILFNIAWLNYKDLKSPENSARYLKRLLKIHPNHLNGWLLLGYVHHNHTGDYAKARNAYETLIERSKNIPDGPEKNTAVVSAHFEICRLFQVDGKYKEGLHCLKQLSKAFPNDDSIIREIKHFEELVKSNK